MTEHKCHAIGCQNPVQPALLMCLKHWKMVPTAIKRKVWSHFRREQCDDKKLSEEWLIAAKEAIQAVRKKETE